MQPKDPLHTTSLEDILYPRSIAVVGASNDPARIGGRPIAYTRRAGFEGRIIPVNIRAKTVQDLPAFPNLTSVDGPIDFAIIALPARAVSDAVHEAVSVGVKTCLIFSSGFAETGTEGAALQNELTEIARAGDMRLIGPNCLGVFNANTGFYPCFTTAIDKRLATPGPFAVASQSGAYGSHIFHAARDRGVNIGHWITTGNEADLDVAEAIHLFAEHEDCEVILAYAEGFTSGERLQRAFARARANAKPVIFMKVGRSPVGREAIASHTAALAGEDRVFDAVCREYGVFRAHTTDEMLDVAYACRTKIYPAGKRLGIISISGGAGVLMADAAEDAGLDVPEMPSAAQDRLKAALPFASPRNPVDVTAQAFNKIDLIATNLKIMLEDGDFDAILAFFTMVAGSSFIADDVRQALKDGIEGHTNKLLALSILADAAVVEGYEDEGFLVFEDPSRAVNAIAALTQFGQSFSQVSPTKIVTVNPLAAKSVAAATNEFGAHTALQSYGIPMVETRLARTADEAAGAVAQFASPCALKICSGQIAHKSDIGGVELNVKDEPQARAVFNQLVERAAKAVANATIEGVLVSPMMPAGLDCIVGTKLDPTFGPIVVCGLGGIFAEVLDDVVMHTAPVSTAQAETLLHSLKGAKMFEGQRGAPPADVTALAKIVSKLSRIAAANADTIRSIDLNPVRVFTKGNGAVALDALVVPQFQAT